MAKVLCQISGLEFKCEHFPIYIERDYAHPIFVASQKKLLTTITKWASGELTETDSYLLFLALLNSTSLVEWRVPVKRIATTSSLIANNMESLAKVIGKINVIKHPAFVLPKFVVSQDTCTLENVHYWIESWNSCILDFQSGYKSLSVSRDIESREKALEKLIKNSTKDISLYSHILADWAELAGDFPKFTVTTPSGEVMACSDYWKSLIRKCCNSEKIFLSSEKDLRELITHCEENILHGSIYSHSLMSLLRAGLDRKMNYLGTGETDLASLSYRIISPESTIEDANKMAMINSAPEAAPALEDYPSKIAYLRAKVKWDMKQEFEKQTNESSLTSPEGTL